MPHIPRAYRAVLDRENAELSLSSAERQGPATAGPSQDPDSRRHRRHARSGPAVERREVPVTGAAGCAHTATGRGLSQRSALPLHSASWPVRATVALDAPLSHCQPPQPAPRVTRGRQLQPSPDPSGGTGAASRGTGPLSPGPTLLLNLPGPRRARCKMTSYPEGCDGAAEGLGAGH